MRPGASPPAPPSMVLFSARMDGRTVGFIGLGHMGSGMARNLVKADVPLVVWDLLPELVRSLTEEGASAAADPAELAERAGDAGLAYADCPVSGMPVRAGRGTLTMMFGGSAELFARARPYLDVMGEFIVHCGDVGMGQFMKAVNNIVWPTRTS